MKYSILKTNEFVAIQYHADYIKNFNNAIYPENSVSMEAISWPFPKHSIVWFYEIQFHQRIFYCCSEMNLVNVNQQQCEAFSLFCTKRSNNWNLGMTAKSTRTKAEGDETEQEKNWLFENVFLGEVLWGIGQKEREKEIAMCITKVIVVAGLIETYLKPNKRLKLQSEQ